MLPRRGKLSQIYPANSAAESKNNFHLNNNNNSNFGNELQVLKGGSDRTIAISNNNQPAGSSAAVASKPAISGISPEPDPISDPAKNEYLKPILFPFGQEPRYQGVQKGYDPYQIPPDYQLALKHRAAMKIGPQINNNNNNEVCICCTRSLSRKELSIGCSLGELAHLGPGYPLYFGFMKFQFYLILTLLATSGGFNLITNILYGDQCGNIANLDYICVDDWITQLSVGSKKEESDLLKIQDILNMASVIVLVGVFQLFRRHIRDTDSKVDKLDISPEDYTILCTNIPNNVPNTNAGDAPNAMTSTVATQDLDTRLQYFLQNKLMQNKKIEIVKVNLAYNLQKVNDLKEQKLALIQKQKDALEYRYAYGEYKANNSGVKIENALHQIDKEINALLDKFSAAKGISFMAENFTGWAFVSLQSAADKDEIIKRYSRRDYVGLGRYLDCSGTKIRILSAPSPTDVFWENVHVKLVWLRVAGSYLIILGLLVGCFFGVQGLLLLQKRISEEKIVIVYSVSFSVQLSAIFLSLIISTANIFFTQICYILTDLERQPSRTLYYSSAIKKVVLCQFALSAVLLFVNQLFFLDTSLSSFNKMFGQTGLIYNIVYVVILNSLSTLFLELLNINGIFKYLQQQIFIRYHTTENSNLNCKVSPSFSLTQQELNELFVDPEFQIINRYATLVKTVFLTAFYSPILPAILPFIACMLIFNYWLDKFNLLKRRSVKYNLSSQIAIEMTELLEYTMILYCAGNILFYVVVMGKTDFSSVSVYQYISIGIGIFHAAFPMQWLNQRIFKVKFAPPNSETFQQASHLFITDYDRENPASSTQAKKEVLQKVKNEKEDEDDEENDAKNRKEVIALQQQQQQNGSFALNESRQGIELEEQLMKRNSPNTRTYVPSSANSQLR